MDREVNSMDFKIAVNILSDYITEKDQQLIRIQQTFAQEYLNQKQTTFNQWLMRTSKQNISKIEIAFSGTKSVLHDMKMDFAYSFFSKCLKTFQQTIRYLIQALNERINKAIDIKISPFIQQKVLCSVIGVTEKQNEGNIAQVCGNEQIIRAKKAISKDLQSIDYYLNLLAYEDSKLYEEYKIQCEKLLLQRQNLQNIKVSDASKVIYETANMIENSLQNTQKLFQQSYLVKYMEFKSFLSSIQEPETIINMFKNDIQQNTKDRFIDTIVKTVRKHISMQKNHERRHKIAMGTQTEETKNKFQEKWQTLIMVQKKNNQKLMQQIEKLKRNSSNFSTEKSNDSQKRFQKESALRKQLQDKYFILESLYNEKCYEIMKMSSKNKKIFKTEISQNQLSISTQTNNQYNKIKSSATSECQTDGEFYYYYIQKNKIIQLQKKIDELQKIIRHKEYIIKELQAVRTFRDRFKSKKQICSIVLKPNSRKSVAKSLHYFHEDEDDDSEAQIYDNKGSVKLNSIEGAKSTKKEVTFKNFDDKQQQTQKSLTRKKKSKKKSQGVRYRPYLTFNQKIQNSDSQKEVVSSKSEFQQPHIISLKSILKIGSTNIKYDQAIQTQVSYIDQIIQKSQNSFHPKIQSRENIIKEKVNSKESKQSRAPSSDSMKNSQRQKNKLQYNFVSRNKSNFIEERKVQSKNQVQNVLPSVHRKSQSVSPFIRRSQFGKSKMLFKTLKPNQRIQTQPNQVLHVNNSLNFNINCFAPINTNMTKKSIRNEKTGLKNDLNRLKKPKK